MEQPLSLSHDEIPLPLPALGLGISSPLSRDMHVFLRIPDCSQLAAAAAMETSAPTSWHARLLAGVVARLETATVSWRRPRTLLAATVGVAVVLGAVVLAAAVRQREPDYADSYSRERNSEAVPWTAATLAEQIPVEAANALMEAPRFDSPPGADTKAAPAQAGSHPPTATYAPQGTSRAGGDKSKATARPQAGPTAHLEQRIDRAPNQY